MGKQRLTPAQKQQVSQFQGITGAAKDQAAECLQASQWNVEAAINLFFNSGLTGGTLQEDSAVTSLYEKYKDQQQDAILADGTPCHQMLHFHPVFSPCLKSYTSVQVLGAFAKTLRLILLT